MEIRISGHLHIEFADARTSGLPNFQESGSLWDIWISELPEVWNSDTLKSRPVEFPLKNIGCRSCTRRSLPPEQGDWSAGWLVSYRAYAFLFFRFKTMHHWYPALLEPRSRDVWKSGYPAICISNFRMPGHPDFRISRNPDISGISGFPNCRKSGIQTN